MREKIITIFVIDNRASIVHNSCMKNREVNKMDFLTIRDFRSSSVWDKLSQKDEVVLTNNGRPVALVLTITDGNFEELLGSVRQAKAMRALNAVRAEAAERGFLSEEEIEVEIRAYRREKRAKQTT